MKKNNLNLNKCCKCQKQKNILKWIMYYGKVAYLCNDCKNLKPSNWGTIENHHLLSDKIQ